MPTLPEEEAAILGGFLRATALYCEEESFLKNLLINFVLLDVFIRLKQFIEKFLRH